MDAMPLDAMPPYRNRELDSIKREVRARDALMRDMMRGYQTVKKAVKKAIGK